MDEHKSASITLIVGSRGLQCTVNLKETIVWESFDCITFDLGPLLQGQTMVGQHNGASISLIIGSRGLQCIANL